MSKIMLINVTHAEETRVGIVSDGVLESFQIEASSRAHQKGNIYKGILHRVHPALEAAFVDIGAPRHAFLPLDEVCFRNLPGDRKRRKPAVRNGQRKRRIQDLLRPGSEILVQIVREEFGRKPPTLTTFYSLPGRYLVLTPGSAEAGISRKIEGEHRARLRALIGRLKPPEGCGIIVRTAAGFDEDAAELERDLDYLTRLWKNIQETASSKTAPCLVYREHDLVIRNIRDYFSPDLDEIIIDNEEAFQRAREFVEQVMPGSESKLLLYDGRETLFSHFDLDNQIESIFRRRVDLPCGGSIVFDSTEALTAIDVNSGGSVRGANQEQTAYKTNREAASEIARQLRLRDLGGLVVIDFIDMRDPKHSQEIERLMQEAMRPDRARYDIGRISRFGLLEISRQRLRPGAVARSYTTCPMCEGHGLVRTTESAALVALRKIQNLVARGDLEALKVTLPEPAALYLMNQKRQDLLALERTHGTRVIVATSDELMPHQSLFEPTAKTEVVSQEVAPGEVAGPEAELAVADGQRATASNGSRRRRRRRGRGRAAGAVPPPTPEGVDEGVAAALPTPEEVLSPQEETPGEPLAAERISAPAEAATEQKSRKTPRRRKSTSKAEPKKEAGQEGSQDEKDTAAKATAARRGRRRRGSGRGRTRAAQAPSPTGGDD